MKKKHVKPLCSIVIEIEVLRIYRVTTCPFVIQYAYNPALLSTAREIVAAVSTWLPDSFCESSACMA
jgi:hypothetical protein